MFFSVNLWVSIFPFFSCFWLPCWYCPVLAALKFGVYTKHQNQSIPSAASPRLWFLLDYFVSIPSLPCGKTHRPALLPVARCHLFESATDQSKLRASIDLQTSSWNCNEVRVDCGDSLFAYIMHTKLLTLASTRLLHVAFSALCKPWCLRHSGSEWSALLIQYARLKYIFLLSVRWNVCEKI